ncbi:MAG: phosphate ABC transporter permease subunit PstC [Gemmataceae bacterium]
MSSPASLPSAKSKSEAVVHAHPAGDRFFRWLCAANAMLVIAVVVSLVGILIYQSLPFWKASGGYAISHASWNAGKGEFGIWALVYGTLATSAIAMLIAVPLGVGSAAFLAEIATGQVQRVGSFLIELLAAIPSVVYGFWGLIFLTPFVRTVFGWLRHPYASGSGILAAGFILAIMIVPYITAISYDVCRAVPRSQREGALALGATRWQTIWTVILPYARPGIFAACFLALGRALGETMAVTMLVGNVARIDFSIFGLGDSIASKIANELNEASSEMHRSALVGLGLVLFVVTLAVNASARFLITRMTKRGPRHAARRRWLSRQRMKSADSVTASKPADPPSNRARGMNTVMTGVLGGCVVATLVPLFLILGFITFRGALALDWDFFTKLPAPPGEPGGGLAHALGGSAMLVGLATFGAVPVGILAAIYLAEYRRSRLVPSVRFLGELLGGVPSIILGIFAYALLVGPTRTFSAWAGAFALGVMMIPVVMRATEEALGLVPNALRNASYALGASQWQTIMGVTVPAALPAIITGVFLAIARIAGETAPLLITAYGSNFWPRGPGDRTPFIAKYIYDYSRSGYPDWERQAWAAALVLLALVMLLNVGIRLATGKRVISASRAD